VSHDGGSAGGRVIVAIVLLTFWFKLFVCVGQITKLVSNCAGELSISVSFEMVVTKSDFGKKIFQFEKDFLHCETNERNKCGECQISIYVVNRQKKAEAKTGEKAFVAKFVQGYAPCTVARTKKKKTSRLFLGHYRGVDDGPPHRV
jgi:hypothetical protein